MIHKARHYLFPCLLLASILLGGLTGIFNPTLSLQLKPLGDLFLNLLFTIIVPLIFFSVTAAIAKSGNTEKLGKLFFYMLAVFLFTGLVAAIFSLICVIAFPFHAHIAIPNTTQTSVLPFSMQLTQLISIPNFKIIFSHDHIFPLIIFSILTGFAILLLKEKGKRITRFLILGERVVMKIFSLIMYYAPIGFFAYFAALIATLGPAILQQYLQVTLTYYALALIYFVGAFSFYAYLADKKSGVKTFWQHALIPSLTALATCSSAATIPANLEAAHNMKVPASVYETTIPLGTLIHKDGSVIGGIIKIAFLFSVFHLSLTTLPAILTAIGVSLLVGTAMGAIPSGGMLGELVILSAYHFPPDALLMIAAISVIIDPPATVLNAVGNVVGSQLINRLTSR